MELTKSFDLYRLGGSKNPNDRSRVTAGNRRFLVQHNIAEAVIKHDSGATYATSYTFGQTGGRYYFSSVVAMCLEDGDCPVQSILRSMAASHDLWFVNQMASVIDGTRKPAPKSRLDIGQLVIFEGRLFQLVSAPNRNIALRQIDADALIFDARESLKTGKCERVVSAGKLGLVVANLNMAGVLFNLSGGPAEFVIHSTLQYDDKIVEIIREAQRSQRT